MLRTMDVEIQNEESLLITQALSRLLADKRFKSSPQMSSFLTYVVKQTQAGKTDRIKAYTIAVDALSNPPSFDPQRNPSVWVLEKRLRLNLERYYQNEGKFAKNCISIKPGSYVPSFHRIRAVDKFANNTGFLKLKNNLKQIFHLTRKVRSCLYRYHRIVTLLTIFSMAVFAGFLTSDNSNDNSRSKKISVQTIPKESVERILIMDIASLVNSRNLKKQGE